MICRLLLILSVGMSFPVLADSYVIEVCGKVQSVTTPLPSPLSKATVGESVRVTFAFDTQAFPGSSSDGFTYLQFSNLTTGVPKSMRSRVTIGGRPFATDSAPFDISLVGAADRNAGGVIPGLSDLDVFYVVDAGFDNGFNNDPRIASARAGTVLVLAVGDPAGSLVTSPVTSFSRRIDFSQASLVVAAVQDKSRRCRTICGAGTRRPAHRSYLHRRRSPSASIAFAYAVARKR